MPALTKKIIYWATLTAIRWNELSVCSGWSWWSFTAKVNEQEPVGIFFFGLAEFSLSSGRLIDFSGLEPRLCPYWSLIPSSVSSPIKSSLSCHCGPLPINTTSLPTSQCGLRYAARLWCRLTFSLTLVCYPSTWDVLNAQSHMNNKSGIDLQLWWGSIWVVGSRCAKESHSSLNVSMSG